MWFLFGEVSSSSGCLVWATRFFFVALPEPSINYLTIFRNRSVLSTALIGHIVKRDHVVNDTEVNNIVFVYKTEETTDFITLGQPL